MLAIECLMSQEDIDDLPIALRKAAAYSLVDGCIGTTLIQNHSIRITHYRFYRHTPYRGFYFCHSFYGDITKIVIEALRK